MELMIESRGKVYDVSHLCSNIEWKTQINQTATLKASIQKVNFPFFEGDSIMLTDVDRRLFKGYIFTKERDKAQVIDITAYDQMRYLKNKDTFVFKNRTATQMIRHICTQFNLRMGVMEDTKFLIESTIEDNKTLIDIIQGTLDKTLIGTNEIFVFYDDFGKLNLKSFKNLTTNLIIGDYNLVTDFKYKTSIDDDVYNRIKLFRDNKKQVKEKSILSLIVTV